MHLLLYNVFFIGVDVLDTLCEAVVVLRGCNCHSTLNLQPRNDVRSLPTLALSRPHEIDKSLADSWISVLLCRHIVAWLKSSRCFSAPTWRVSRIWLALRFDPSRGSDQVPPNVRAWRADARTQQLTCERQSIAARLRDIRRTHHFAWIRPMDCLERRAVLLQQAVLGADGKFASRQG